MVAELESSGAWRGDGAGNLAAWMCARWQISQREARELIRDASALKERPALHDALACGSISVDQCKALATLSEPGTDDAEAWLETLEFWSLAELEREARKKIARELERRDDGTYLRMSHTKDERYLRGEFQLHPEDGAMVMSAIDARVPKDTPLRAYDHAAALALVELAKGSSGNGERPMVLVSVPESDDVATLRSGGLVGMDTAHRLACDARTQVLYTDAAGKMTGVGKTSRTIPPSLRRAVEERDHGMCTFPGCGRTVFLECHHIVHYADGGPTELWNLLLVCWTHHTLVHEGGWSLHGEAGPHITWVRPDGSPFEPRVRVVLDTC